MELELKLKLNPTLERTLAALAVAPLQRQFRSLYYDTPAGDLTNAQIAFRIRQIDDAWVQTIKAELDGVFERFEFEEVVGGPHPHADALPPTDTAVGALVAQCYAMLMPLFETDFERTIWPIEPRPGLRIEVARDIGEIRYGAQSEAIAEVEVELKTGTRADFFAWVREFVVENQAGLLLPTKGERGLRLAARIASEPVAQRATPFAVAANDLLVLASVALLRSCLGQALGNVPVILSSEAPEGPHQFRVGLRRLRAAIRFLQLHTEPTWQAIDERAKEYATLAGRVRNCDVLQLGLLVELNRSFPSDAALIGLEHALRRSSVAARSETRDKLGGAEFARFVLDTLQAVASIEGREDGGRSFGAFAPMRLAQLAKRLKRRKAAAHDEAGWHRVRIAIKNLRYALEFSRSALGPDPQAQQRVAKLFGQCQDQLGQKQDLAVARQVAAEALRNSDLPAHSLVRAVALIDGWRAFSSARAPKVERGVTRALAGLRGLLATPERPQRAPKSVPPEATGSVK